MAPLHVTIATDSRGESVGISFSHTHNTQTEALCGHLNQICACFIVGGKSALNSLNVLKCFAIKIKTGNRNTPRPSDEMCHLYMLLLKDPEYSRNKNHVK